MSVTAVRGADAAKPAGPLDFTLTGNDGKPFDLGTLRGKVVLLVNVASKCGLTPQYTELQALHERYQARGLVVLGVPANDFGAQEPGTDAEIRTFCTSKYNVTFPLLSKISVKGDAMHPLYRWLTVSSPKTGDIAWNFTKFLIGRDGAVIDRFEPKVTPGSADVAAAIEKALGPEKK
ncbi:MAG: glutathione peroxidase [Planctomycetes bacterium]|nr:glutathione peroxidase [Planctomycetota bacterium]